MDMTDPQSKNAIEQSIELAMKERAAVLEKLKELSDVKDRIDRLNAFIQMGEGLLKVSMTDPRSHRTRRRWRETARRLATVKENLTVHPDHPGITLLALIDLLKHNEVIFTDKLPMPLVTTKGIYIGRWLNWGPDLGGDMTVTLELVDNLAEVAQGLSVPVIEKAFNETGIVLKITTPEDAEQEGKERLEEPPAAADKVPNA